MKKVVHTIAIAAFAFLAVGLIFDIAAGTLGQGSPTGAVTQDTLETVYDITWDFSVVRFLCQILLSAGLATGFWLKAR